MKPGVTVSVMTRIHGAGRYLLVVGVAAVLITGTVRGFVGVADADPGSLLTNGSFETTTTPVSGVLTVDAGDSTTIQGWTVVTPSAYGGTGGSVDVISNSYWNAEDGNNSIDLAGTTGVPGGIYQDVTTTKGYQYVLSYWSAVNGDESPGIVHTIDVVFDGAVVGTTQAAGMGRPLYWVEHSITVTATSTTSHIEFDDVTSGDVNQGPALDNVSFDPVPAAAITINPGVLSPETTNAQFTVPLATFTSADPAATSGEFTALINWGDGSTSDGVIGGAGPFQVTGSHTYASHGSYTVSITVDGPNGATATVTEPVVVADAVATCSSKGCSGSITTPTQSEQFSSSSTTGSIQTDLDSSGVLSCHDLFRHAPQIGTVTDTGLTANIVITDTFPNKDSSGSWLVPFAVCYQAQTPFTDLLGKKVTTGLLPPCPLPLAHSSRPLVAPCVQSITELPLYRGNVVETIVVPPGDPRHS
jgi:choice-of-anchor C domain-containing protein